MKTNQTIIIKVGTGVLTTDKGLLDESMVKQIVDEIVVVKKHGIRIVLVSSGAMGAGRTLLTPAKKLTRVEQRQILAAVGQVKLMSTYAAYFKNYGYHSAQVLATKEDFRDRHHYLNMKNCFTALLNNDVVPIVNENDVVAVDELMFTDNDELAGLVTSLLNAERLIILTTVNGILDREGKSIAVVDRLTNLEDYIENKKSTFGRGGMLTKSAVAKRLAKLGTTTHIIDGKQPENISKIIAGEMIGTTFLPEHKVSPHKKWLAHARGNEQGSVIINQCAEEIFQDNSKATSLLPVGITNIQGEFKKGDIVKIIGPTGRELGYGRANYAADDIQKVLGKKNQRPFIHYDYLFLDV